MSDETDRVQSARAGTLAIIRVCAVALIVWGAFQIGARLVFAFVLAVPSDTPWNALRVWSGVGSEHGLVRGVPALVIGLGLALWSGRLSRWIVRPPGRMCPCCDYEGFHKSRWCTECGYGEAPDGGSSRQASRDAPR